MHGISYNGHPLAQSINRCTDYKVFTQVLGMLYVGPGGPGVSFPKGKHLDDTRVLFTAFMALQSKYRLVSWEL